MFFASPAFLGSVGRPQVGGVLPGPNGGLPAIASPFFAVDADAANTLFAATTGTTPAVSGGGVARITDAFGGALAMVQGTTAARPELVGAAVNGRNALRFAGTGGRSLALPTTGNPGNAMRGSWTLIAAYVPRFTGQERDHYLFRAGAASPPGNLRHVGLMFNPRVLASRNTDDNYVYAGDAGYSHRDDEVVLVVARYSRANGLRVRAIAAGGTREASVPAGADATDDVDWPSVVLGANISSTNAPTDFFSGDICEVRAWGADATDAQVGELLTYLGAKWVGNVAVPQPPPPTNVNVAPPQGWGMLFEDEFLGTSLDTAKWNLTYSSGQSPNNDTRWDARGRVVDNGVLRLRLFIEDGVWHGGGIQQGNAVTGFAGYGDFQVEVEAEIPAGQGVGVYALMWPVSDQWPPEFDLIETPGPAKDTVLVNWHWPGPNGEDYQAPATYAVDVKRRIRYIARREGVSWRYWTLDVAAGTLVERPVPAEWAQNPHPARLALGIAMFVAQPGASWYGGAPDGTTPNPYEVLIHSARIYAPTSAAPPAASRSIAIQPQQPGAMQESVAGQGVDWPVTIQTTGLSAIAWVVVRSDYVWRGSSPTVTATNGSVQIVPRLLATGDFLKVFDPTDYSFASDSGAVTIQAPSGTVTPNPTPTGGLAQAQAFAADLTLGMNVERFNAYGWSGLQNSTTYWAYLKGLGFTHVRIFYPWRTRADWSAPGGASDFNQILNSTQQAINAGLKVFLDFTDVLEDWDIDDYRQGVVDEHIAMCAAECAKRNFDPLKFCPGPVNEFGGTGRNGVGMDNQYWQEHRHRWMTMLRQALPNYTLSEGPAYWKDPRFLYGEVGASNHPYVPWPGDLNVIQDVHHYSDWGPSGLIYMADRCETWRTANQNRVVYSGEWGTGGSFEDVGGTQLPYADWEWINRWDANLTAPNVARLGPTLWCVTGGNAWTMNKNGGGYLKDGSNGSPDLQGACQRLAAEIKAVRGISDTPPTSPPPSSNPVSATVDGEYPVFGGSISALSQAGVMVRGQSNAGFYTMEAIWGANIGMEAMLGGTHARFNAGPGLDNIDGWALNQGALTGPERFTNVGGVPLWRYGDSYCFLNAQNGVDPSQWARGTSGQALRDFITTVMTSGDRAACPGVFYFHTENDCEEHGMSDLATHLAALKRTFALMRADFGRPATGTNALPIFAAHPIPFAGNGGGHRMIREAYHALMADTANNFHVVVGQTADSWGGLRYGATQRDYAHRDTDDLTNVAIRLAFGAGRVLNSQRGVGSRNFPGLGPKVVHALAESATSTLLTVAHDKGTALRLGTGAGDGRGWVIHDNTVDRSVTGATLVGSSQIRLSHAGCTGTVAQRRVSYCLYGQELGRGSGIYDNWSTRPAPSGWPAGLSAQWRIDFPLRGSLVPQQHSTSPFAG